MTTNSNDDLSTEDYKNSDLPKILQSIKNGFNMFKAFLNGFQNEFTVTVKKLETVTCTFAELCFPLRITPFCGESTMNGTFLIDMFTVMATPVHSVAKKWVFSYDGKLLMSQLTDTAAIVANPAAILPNQFKKLDKNTVLKRIKNIILVKAHPPNLELIIQSVLEKKNLENLEKSKPEINKRVFSTLFSLTKDLNLKYTLASTVTATPVAEPLVAATSVNANQTKVSGGKYTKKIKNSIKINLNKNKKNKKNKKSIKKY